MNLIDKYNVQGILEDKMQEYVADYFSKLTFRHTIDRWNTDWVNAETFREITIPEISRTSDVIVKITDRKIFNIECKLNDSAGVVDQALDHKRWADYSYVCLHSHTYIPSRDINEMVKNGIGLLLYQEQREYWEGHESHNRVECIMEAFGAYKSKKIDKKIRQSVLKKLKILKETNAQLKIETP